MTPHEWFRENGTHPKPGDCLVEGGTNLICRLIQWRQGGKWSHVSIPLTQTVKVESHMLGGFQANLMNACHSWALLRLVPEVQAQLDVEVWERKLSEFCTLRVRYDLLGILGSLLNRPAIQRERRLYCSEVLRELVFASAGVDVASRGWPWPQRVYESNHYQVIHEENPAT